MKTIKLLPMIAILLTQACANPSIVNVNQQAIGVITDESIVFIPRFEGNPDFVEESTDYFVTLLETKIPNTVIQASVIRTESTDIKSGGNIAPLEIALDTAREKGANVLILGKVTSHKGSGTLNGFATVRVYDVGTGDRIANFHRPSGLLLANIEHQCVMAAVKRTASDVVNILK